MKRSLVALVVFGFAASQANAALLTLSKGDAYYVGEIVNAAPANPADEASYINHLITLAAGAGDIQLPPGTGETYDRIGSTLVPAPPGFHTASATSAFKDETAPFNPVTLTNKYHYIYGKYGGGALVWFSATGFTGEVGIPNDFNGDEPGGGLSHFSAYNLVTAPPPSQDIVPEPTSVAAWLIGVVCCGGFARLRKRTPIAAV